MAILVPAGSLFEDPAFASSFFVCIVPAGSLFEGLHLQVLSLSVYLLMAIKTFHDTFDKTWFVTFTCYKWLPLFELTNSYDLVYKWLNLIQSKAQADTLSFVLMPNHVHCILQLSSEGVNLNSLISNGKRFMAYEMVSRLKYENNHSTLTQLAEACSEKEKAKGQRHKVFEPSFDAKPIYTDVFFYQKLNYIHQNPVTGKWRLSTDFVQYAHSSAAFYETGTEHTLINIKDYREVGIG
jgi:REP element-mobilizing transposase RayT